MPKIPLYGRQEKLPATRNAYLENPEAQGRVGRAVTNLGQDLLKQSNKLRNEREELDVLEAMKSLSDESRNYLMEARKQEGLNAVGATDRAGQFYDDTIKRYTENMSRGVAQKFQERALTIRNGGMNTMASHESQQHRIRQQNAIKVVVDTFSQAMSDGAATEKALRIGLTEMRETVDNVYAGHDEATRQAIKKGTEQQMIRTWVQERAKFQPEDMYSELEWYRSDLPAPVFEQLKDSLKKKVDESWVDSQFWELKTVHKDDYKAMLEEANKTKDKDRRRSLVARVKDDYTTNKVLNADMKKEAQDNILRDIVTTFGKKNYAEVRRMALASVDTLEPEQVEHWVKTIDAIDERELRKEETKGPFEVSDDDILSAVMHEVATRPNDITIWDIWKLQGKGLSTKDCQRVQGILLRNQKRVPESLQEVFDVIKAWEKNNEFSASDAENVKAANNLRHRIEEFIEQYPERSKDLVNEFIVPEHKKLKKQKFDEAFESFRSTFTTLGERGGEKQTFPITKPKKRVSPFDDSKFVKEWLGE